MKCSKRMIGLLCALVLLFAFALSAQAMDFDAETAYESVFVIYSGKYVGSGFAIGPNSVVTNAHVIGDEYAITLDTYHGDTFKASVHLIDEDFDIAILAVENAEFTPFTVGDNASLKSGDDIYAIGAPKSMGYTLTKGIVSNKERTYKGYSYIQIDAAINSGNSGGPLLTDSGQVVGVNTLKADDAEGIGFAIPMSSVVSYMEENGVKLTEDQTIDGEIPYVVKDPGDDRQKSGDEELKALKKDYQSAHTLNAVLIILLVISVVFNVILLILLLKKKKIPQTVEYLPDASERTDCEIDILE